MKFTIQLLLGFSILFLFSCDQKINKAEKNKLPNLYIKVLGIAQDGGYPHAGCYKSCCNLYRDGKEKRKQVTCLALIDRLNNRYWLIEASPDLPEQLRQAQQCLGIDSNQMPAGILITHAHIGHYTGLMYFGREVMGSSAVPVYGTAEMCNFLKVNGPWSQLVNLNNISLRTIKPDSSFELSRGLKVTAIRVPHRDEYSNTVGYIIESAHKKVLFIPDIDKWEKWDLDIRKLVNSVDYSILDGTFYRNGELAGRDMKEVPHPFVEESRALFDNLPDGVRSRVMFIHFNHTNPLIRVESEEKNKVLRMGYGVAEEGMVLSLD